MLDRLYPNVANSPCLWRRKSSTKTFEKQGDVRTENRKQFRGTQSDRGHSMGSTGSEGQQLAGLGCRVGSKFYDLLSVDLCGRPCGIKKR